MKLMRLLTIAIAFAATLQIGCAEDATAECGNGVCESGETNLTCPGDCPAAVNNCGNSRCDVGENPTTCATDCPVDICGNHACEATENVTSCPGDCAAPVCPDGFCNGTETTATCAQDCPAAVCPDGFCNGTETTATCPADCPAIDCGDITIIGNGAGAVCDNKNPCDGACLVQTEGAASGICYQECIPGHCIDMCIGDEQCLTLADDDGNPVVVDGVTQGVCGEPPTGDTAVYGDCSESACESGACADLSLGGAAPFCTIECDQGADPVCPSHGTYPGTCSLMFSGTTPTHCGILCNPAEGDCPEGMECFAAGGGGFCLWPDA